MVLDGFVLAIAHNGISMDTGHTRSVRLRIPEGIARQHLHIGDTIELMRITDTEGEHIMAEVGPIEAFADERDRSESGSSAPTLGTTSTKTRRKRPRSNRDKTHSRFQAPIRADILGLHVN
eukprot:16445915-Heterocapsa_arctica.AAC.1